MMIASIISVIILSFISGICKAIVDLSEEGNLKFKNEKYWIKAKSWVRKWKRDKNDNPILVEGNKVEKFKFSSTILVMITDAWHLFGNFYNRTTKATGVFIGILSAMYSWYFLLGFIVSSIVYAGTFHIFYTKAFRKK